MARVDGDPWGSVRPSLYETARVTSAAPWLPGEALRVTRLLDAQDPDGTWGEGPRPYRLLPTLAVVEAGLAVLARDRMPAPVADRLRGAAVRGLAALRALPPDGPWPDTAAAEILVPDLVARIHGRLERLGDSWPGGLPEPAPVVPGGYHAQAPAHVAAKYGRAEALPVKFHHTFEGVAGHLPARLVPSEPGLLGSSPAATAARAALAPGDHARAGAAVAALTPVAERYDGLFPEAAPVLVFERLWVAAALLRAGLLSGSPLATVRAWAQAIHDPEGVRGAPGLMVDADDTAMAVLVSSLTGLPHGPEPLERFRKGDHYDCYLGEDTGSVTANAHALRALVRHLARHPGESAGLGPRAAGLARWLAGEQHPEGYWPDKWHASPYYATQRCVTALAGLREPAADRCLAAAAEWTLETQREDGSWGVWGGTAEETAYAVQILLDTADVAHRTGTGLRHEEARRAAALERAEACLAAAADSGGTGLGHPALWHDKTLYAPAAMIEAEVLAARALLRARRQPAAAGQRD